MEELEKKRLFEKIMNLPCQPAMEGRKDKKIITYSEALRQGNLLARTLVECIVWGRSPEENHRFKFHLGLLKKDLIRLDKKKVKPLLLTPVEYRLLAGIQDVARIKVEKGGIFISNPSRIAREMGISVCYIARLKEKELLRREDVGGWSVSFRPTQIKTKKVPSSIKKIESKKEKPRLELLAIAGVKEALEELVLEKMERKEVVKKELEEMVKAQEALKKELLDLEKSVKELEKILQ